VKLPAMYNAAALLDPASGILKEATDLSFKKVRGQNEANREDKLAAHYTDEAEKETDAKKTDLLNKAKAHKDAADAWKAALAVWDSFFTRLTTADDKGVIPLANVVRDGVVADALCQDNLLLVVKLQKSGGAYYTKKNMWTFFGCMPFYHMGGVVVSYVLLSGKEGRVVKSGVVPVHGGFVKAGNLARHVDEQSAALGQAQPQAQPKSEAQPQPQP